MAICLSYVTGHLSAALSPYVTLTAQQSEVQLESTSYVEDSVRAACQGFRAVEETTDSGWLLEDCTYVWRSWGLSLNEGMASQKEDREFFFDISDRLRQRGTPCYVEPVELLDGIGSRSMRLLAAWVYAEEMGCKYLLPKGNRGVSGARIDDTMYCHRSQYMESGESDRCVAFDWVGYFNLSAHISSLPNDGGETTRINVSERTMMKESARLSTPKHEKFAYPTKRNVSQQVVSLVQKE